MAGESQTSQKDNSHTHKEKVQQELIEYTPQEKYMSQPQNGQQKKTMEYQITK